MKRVNWTTVVMGVLSFLFLVPSAEGRKPKKQPLRQEEIVAPSTFICYVIQEYSDGTKVAFPCPTRGRKKTDEKAASEYGSWKERTPAEWEIELEPAVGQEELLHEILFETDERQPVRGEDAPWKAPIGDETTKR
jgi:hypothetical protein